MHALGFSLGCFNLTMADMTQAFTEIIVYRKAFAALIFQYFKLKYRRTLLGYFWVILNPLLMWTVLAVVFSELLERELMDFAFLLFSVLPAWNLLSGSTIQTTTVFHINEPLLKKIYVPKILLPVTSVIGNLGDAFFFAVPIFLVLAFGGAFNLQVLVYFPLIFPSFLCFVVGVVLLTSLLSVYFRDFQWLVPIAFQALFFMTPILYEKKLVSGLLLSITTVNPLTPYMSALKDIFYFGVPPQTSDLWIGLGFGLASLTMGLVLFSRFQDRLIFRL